MFRNREKVDFFTIKSLEQFREEAEKIKGKNTFDTNIFVIKGHLAVYEKGIEIVRKIGSTLRDSNSMVIVVIDGMIDLSVLDCLISADICIATKNGKCNLDSEYIQSGLYSLKHIAYLLGDKNTCNTWYVNQIDGSGKFIKGGFINYILEISEPENKMIENIVIFVNSLLFGKNEEQLIRIKLYFNLYKKSHWDEREILKEMESKLFCFLSHKVGEVESANEL